MNKYKNEDEIIEALHNHFFITEVNGADWFDQIMNQVVDVIRNVPERRGKKKVYYHGENTFSYACDQCAMPIDGKDAFCRWCGAKMEE